MEFDHYQVIPGDTLSKIARQHGVDMDELANINHIREPNFIRIGQQLKIPRKAPAKTDDEDFYSELWVRFVDALGNPIAKLKARIVTADGEYQCITDDIGLLPPVRTVNKDDKPQVFVEKLGGGEKKIIEISAPPGTHQFTLRSPKLKLETTLRPHEGIPDHSPGHPLKLEPGQVQHNRDLRGNPVINIGMECPNKDNLRLGPNHKYREYILAAAKRAEIQPQAIAAIMNAEAASVTVMREMQVRWKGKPATHKDGSPKMRAQMIMTGEWNPKSASPTSSARGMTQFLDGTWIAMAVTDGSFLNEKVRAKGWLKNDAKNKIVFVLADGTSDSFTERDLLMHVTGRANADDENVKALLDLRYDPECAIHTAVDYAKQNTSVLQKKGYELSSLNSAERAKVMYASHHLGSRDVHEFIQEHISEQRAKELLVAQVKSRRAEDLAETHGGSYVLSHRHWLNNYIEKKITPKTFACNSTLIDEGRNFLEITAILKKNKT